MTAQRARISLEGKRWRAAILAMSAVGVLYWVLATFQCSPLLPWCGTAGFGVEYQESSAAVVVSRVDAGGPASVGGLRLGDRISLATIPFSTRYWLRAIRSDWAVPAHYIFHLPVQRGQQQLPITVLAQPVHGTLTWSSLIAGAANLWGLLFAIFLTVRVPDSRQARLLSLILVTYFTATQTGGLVPWAALDFVIYLLNLAVSHALPISLASVYAATFARPLSSVRRWLLYAGVALPIVGAAASTSAGILWYVFALPFDWLRTIVVGTTVGTGCIVSVAAGVIAAIASRGPERRRAAWSTVAIGPVWLMWAYSYMISPYVSQQAVNNAASVAAVAAIFMPLGLTYAVLTRRFVDIGFVVSRTLVFGAISLLVLGTFILAEWVIGQWIAATNRTAGILINVFIALGVGLSVQFLHTRIAHMVNQAFFRKRHEDHVALRRFSSEAAFITERDVLLGQTVSMLRRHTEAEHTSIFLRNADATYECVAGDHVGRVVSENDPVIVALRAWHRPVDLHGYETAVVGDLAFPMSVRANLFGVVVCGAKPSGEAWAPDEFETLEQLTHNVGGGLDLLGTREPRDRLEAKVGALVKAVEEISEQNRLLLRELLAYRETESAKRS